MANVKVNEMLRLCPSMLGQIFPYEGSHHGPCVTKLPKLRPTMQCQVAPFLASNCKQGGVSSRLSRARIEGRAHGLFDVFGDILSIRSTLRGKNPARRLYGIPFLCCIYPSPPVLDNFSAHNLPPLHCTHQCRWLLVACLRSVAEATLGGVRKSQRAHTISTDLI